MPLLSSMLFYESDISNIGLVPPLSRRGVLTPDTRVIVRLFRAVHRLSHLICCGYQKNFVLFNFD